MYWNGPVVVLLMVLRSHERGTKKSLAAVVPLTSAFLLIELLVIAESTRGKDVGKNQNLADELNIIF